MLKILMVTELFPPNCSGGGWSTYNLARAIENSGELDVTVLAVNMEECLDEGLDVEKISVNRFPNELAYSQIRKEVEKRMEDYDIVQAQHSLSIPSISSVDKPTVGIIRDYWPVCYKTTLRDNFGNNHLHCGYKCIMSVTQDFHVFTPYKLFNHYSRKKKTQNVDFLATKSDFVKERLEDKDFTNAETVHDFVGKEFYKQVEEKGRGDIIYFGKLTENKGVQVLIEAIPKVLDEHGDQQFTIFGLETGFSDQLKRTIESKGIEDNVDFLGRIPFDEVKSRVKGAKAVVHPSQWHEPLSRVCVESLSLGTPVISTSTGGSPEIIKHEDTGLIFEGEEDLAEQLIRIQSQELREEISSNGKRLIEEEFSEQKILQKWKNIYRKLV